MFSWNKYPLLRILFPFVVGIIIVFYTDIAFPVGILFTIMVLCMLAVMILYKFPRYHTRWINGILIIVSILSFSLCYTRLFIDEGKPLQLLKENNTTVFIASVIESPSIRPTTVKLIVQINSYQYHDTFRNDNSKAVLYVERDQQAEQIAYGDKLVFYTHFIDPPTPANPQAFDYRRYLSIKNIYLTTYIKANAWQKISEKNGTVIMQFATNARNKFLKIFKECNMDVQEYGIITAMLLGYDDELDADLEQKYNATGVSHILCVSGLHVGIIYMILSFLLRFFNKTKGQRICRLFILGATIWMYACITGLSPSVMRASTMFSFVAIGNMLERRTNIYNSLLTSMFFLLLWNPLVIFEIGFQFSYLAVFGIVWIQQPLYLLYTPRTKIENYIWSIMTVSFAAQLFTAPLSMLYFHQFPNYFLLTNIFVITLAPIIIGLGIGVLVFSFWGFAYKCLSLVLIFLIKGMNWIISSIEALPYSVTGNIDLSGLQVIFIYLLIIFFISARFYAKKSYLFQALIFAILIMGLDMYKQIQTDSQKEIIFYSVKSGYAIDCIDGQNAVLICDNNTITDQTVYDYSIENNHIYHRIKNTETITGLHFIRFHNKTILIIDQAVYAIPFKQKLKVDYILLHNNVNVSIETLKKMIDFKMIITSGKYSYYHLANIRKACAQQIIPYHELKNQDALIVY
ncbi:MAG: competence protein ComEC family protein [Bacteroidales bacterium]|jgi:competence protein ComEC|nr:competence protein ComEC family protein [Bacteroidales bacterium]